MTEPTTNGHSASGSRLRPVLSTLAVTLYGVGVIVGAGIYVLVGEIASVVGAAAWLAFLGAAVAALPTGLAYAELASRYPRAAGEAVFVSRAFRSDAASFVAGFLVLASGVVSTAALSHGFARYFGDLTGLAADWRPVVILAFLGGLTCLNHRGIRESAWFNAGCTVISVGTLLVIVAAAVGKHEPVDLLAIAAPGEPVPPDTWTALALLWSGAALAFYAFIGFEDICNVAEETREPTRSIPRAILIALAVSAVLYVLVAITVVAVVPVERLSDSDVPLALVWREVLPGWSPRWLDAAALLAVSNSALFNMIMASRVAYGLGTSGWIPAIFSSVHRDRGTPTWGVLGVFLLASALALTGLLRVLAEATNVTLLTVFCAVNLALIVVKFRRVPPDDPARRYFRVPVWVPFLGLTTAAVLAVRFSAGAYLRTAALLAVGALLFAARTLARRNDHGRGRPARHR